jgi:pyridoxine 5-phosphate synthase
LHNKSDEKTMTRLSVNINKIATLRNTRQGNTPNVALAAINCQKFGAEGITVHPRPDERHIRYADVWELKPLVTTEFNIEGYPSEKFLELVLAVKPDQVTLVPDPPEAITSNAGWDTIQHKDFLTDVISAFKNAGIRTSLFVGTDPEMIETAALVGANRVELYTEPYATDYPADAEKAIKPFKFAAKVALENNLGLNAGHDLSLINLRYFKQSIPNLLEVSIGHALISDALYLGLEQTIRKYKECLS